MIDGDMFMAGTEGTQAFAIRQVNVNADFIIVLKGFSEVNLPVG